MSDDKFRWLDRYWPPTVLLAVGALTTRMPKGGKWSYKEAAAAMASVGRQVETLTAGTAVAPPGMGHPELVARAKKQTGSRYAHSCKNPSVRRPGKDDWAKLLHRAGDWWAAAECLAQHIGTDNDVASIAEMLRMLQGSGVTVYNGDKKHYQSAKLCRSLVMAFGKSHLDSPDDWANLSVMGAGAKAGIIHWGIKSYADAVQCRDEFRALTGPSYSLLDLVCMACLCGDG